MAGSTFYGTTNNQYIDVGIVWEGTVDSANNQSIVTASLYARKSSSASSDTHGPGEWKLYINGVSTSISKYVTLNNDNEWVKLGSATVAVPHNPDGTKSIQIYATGGITYTSYTSTSISATVALDAIPRATFPTFGGLEQIDIGANLVITLNRTDPSFTHKVMYSWQNGLAAGTIGVGIGTSVTWQIPMSFLNQIPNAASGLLVISVITYNAGGTVVGGETGSITCNVPASAVPTIGAVTASDTGGIVPSAWGLYIKGKSTLHVFVTAAGVYGSSIIGYEITALGTTRTANNTDIGVINLAGSVPISVKVTDSRGRTKTTDTSINVIDYAAPAIGMFEVRRVNDTGTPVDNGTYCKASLKASGTDVNGKNTVTAKIYHKRSDLSDWTLARTISVAYSVDTFYMIADMVPSRSYAYKVEVTDQFTGANPSASEKTLPAEGAVIGWMPGGVGVSFGKAAEEEDRADFGWKMHARLGAIFDAALEVADSDIGYESLLNLGGLPLYIHTVAVDFNTLIATGIHGIRFAPSSYNAPVSNWGTLIVMSALHTGTMYQIYIPDGANSVIYKRGYSGNAWAGWIMLFSATYAAKTHTHATSDVTNLKATLLNMIYPIGSIYVTSEPNNPATLFGGTWTQIRDRFLVAAGSTFAGGATGGSSTHKHKVPVAYTGSYQGVAEVNGHTTADVGIFKTSAIGASGSSAPGSTVPYTSEENNLPPYEVVFMWKRTA